jgi:hypothetical protein
MPVAWCLADPKIGEREVAGELLAHAARTGALRQLNHKESLIEIITNRG